MHDHGSRGRLEWVIMMWRGGTAPAVSTSGRFNLSRINSAALGFDSAAVLALWSVLCESFTNKWRL